MKTKPRFCVAAFHRCFPEKSHKNGFPSGVVVAVALLCVAVFGACGGEARAGVPAFATSGNAPQVRALLEGIMPEAMADGIVKVALLVNEKDGGNTWQFIEAGVSEGRSMGFTVDAFALDADAHPERFREIAAGIARADYDGLIFVNGTAGFSYDILRPIADAGIRIVTFEALPFRDGRAIPGLVTTFRDDYSLARLSLETLVSYVGDGTGRPPMVLRVTGRPGTTFLDRHDWEFDEFVRTGRIAEVRSVRLPGLDNPGISAWEAVSAALPGLPPGSADAVWVPWSEFAMGVAAALNAAGRRDVKVFSSGVSNESLRLMQRYREIWLASTTVDHKLAGTVTMRILAALLAGETPNDTFLFSPQLVRTADLNRAVNVANLSIMLPDWDDGTGLFDRFPWMNELKAAETRFPRISDGAFRPGPAR